MRRIAGLTIGLVACLTGVAQAAPPVYPPPTKPTIQGRPKGPFHTLREGPRGRTPKALSNSSLPLRIAAWWP